MPLIGRRVRASVWGVGMLIGTAGAVRAAGQQPPTLTRRDRPEVTKVTIDGAKDVDAGALADGLVTHASHCKSLVLAPFCLIWKTPLFYERDYLDRKELKRDVLRALIFLYRHGYHDAVVDTVVDPPAGLQARITFRVQEGPPTILTAFTLDTPPKLIAKKALGPDVIPLRIGRPFDLFELDSAVANIQNLLNQRGYADAKVDTSTVITPGDSGKPSASLRMKVTPGKINTVGQIVIAGNQRIATNVVRRSLGFKEGDIYKRGQGSS